MSIDVFPPRHLSTAQSVLAHVTKSGHQTGITTEVAVTELAATVAFLPNRIYRIEAFLNMVTSADAQGGQARIKMDGAEIQFAQETPGGASRFTLHPKRVLMPGQYTPGARDITITVLRTGASNTVDVNSWSTDPCYLLIEDITGGSGGPGPFCLDSRKLTASVSGITTETALAGLSSTVIVPAGRKIKISIAALFSRTVADGVSSIFIREGGTLLGAVDSQPNVPTVSVSSGGFIILEPSAGTHTYAFSLVQQSGTGTSGINANAQWPTTVTVEDVTGTAAPTGAYYEAVWTPVTAFLNSWVNYDTALYTAAAYRKVNDIVYLRGLVKSGTVIGAIFNLPAGYRPLRTHHYAVVANNLLGTCRIQPSGDVEASNGSNTWFSLDGISLGVT